MATSDGADKALAERLQREEYFANETFEGVDLQGLELRDKEFYRCTFESCQLQESRWQRTVFEACVVRGSNVTRARFLSTGLREVRFEGSKLMGIDWSDLSSNPELSFQECGLSYCSFVGLSLRKTPFLKCVARESNFYDLDLTDADFTGSDLGGSNFRGCMLLRADFSDTTGVFLDPSVNKLKDTRVPIETAVGLARNLGMLVAGFHDEAPKRAGRKSRPSP
ncbi:pentapeptide repeat-containing protein [Myxococcus stipitatus]|uniref:pentapeptide repeat-containing protein n=1 Tax=Myxococcus stipitatus TaxID=83455 RepID=UPI0031456EE0